ncbi:DJ-1/PfpI family protein [Natronocalculus amylovorans]|uniref:DJ-1/PfpI family protein n=1 Tax=Natronocalculus amylovorans TaxID=2917812 RepID=A0AAE3FYT0_9EURY|nr:DJ-1/PfpI family protein [Natronocalculus amylovorans]MCL9817809.1 DJ-1/PfpI family protein [Natronocalculus amylovorans]
MKIGILLYQGFDEIDAIGPFEVFENAIANGADADVRLYTLESTDQITASHGLRVGVDGVLPEPTADDRPDLLVVPGGGWAAKKPEASAWAEAQKGEVPDAIAAYHAAGVPIAAVCTGGMLLATAGVTDGRRAITHGSAINELEATDAVVVHQRVVDDGDIITAGGVTSGIDLALHLVEREFGESIAAAVATTMEYERRTEPYSPA